MIKLPEPVATVTDNFKTDYSEISRTYEAPIYIGTKLVTLESAMQAVRDALKEAAEIADTAVYKLGGYQFAGSGIRALIKEIDA